MESQAVKSGFPNEAISMPDTSHHTQQMDDHSELYYHETTEVWWT